jgi:hypothetical protein
MKIIGKIIAVQNARQGEGVNGTWYIRDYVIEDETHPGEGVVVSTFNTSIMQQIGKQTQGQLTVEAEYTPRLRFWDGKRRDGSQGESNWKQTNDMRHLRILTGTPANAVAEQAQAPVAQPVLQQAQPVQQPAQQPVQQAQVNDDLPF